MIRKVILALACVFVAFCGGCMPQPTPTPLPDGDDCARACGRLRELGCEDGQPTASGASCETVCEHDSASTAAALTPAYLQCISRLASCDERACTEPTSQLRARQDIETQSPLRARPRWAKRYVPVVAEPNTVALAGPRWREYARVRR